MTVEKLHDALTLLPSDLVTATDRLRTAPKAVRTPWKRVTAMAACLALLICGGFFMMQKNGGMVPIRMKQESAAEAPAAMAPAMPENGVIEEYPAEEAKQEAPAADTAGGTASQTAGKPEEEFWTDHSHSFAEESDRAVNSPAYCGNMMTTVHMDGADYSFAGTDSVTVTDILISLDYNPDHICRCMEEFTVDTEMIDNIQVNLTEGFARCEKGQASLTENQAETLREIIRALE